MSASIISIVPAVAAGCAFPDGRGQRGVHASARYGHPTRASTPATVRSRAARPSQHPSMRRRADARAIVIGLLVVLASEASARAQDLVTPVRVGRADAPLTLNVWAQQDYSHLAARPAIADVFASVFDDWARAHPDVQLRVSVMPGLEL